MSKPTSASARGVISTRSIRLRRTVTASTSCRRSEASAVHEHVAGQHKRERAKHRQVAPVSPRQDLSGDNREEDRWKGEVEDRRCARADHTGEKNRDATACPEEHECGQSAALERHPSGPVGNRGEEKTGDDGGRIAKYHFVRMPDRRHQLAWDRHAASIDGQPKGNRDRRP